MFGLCYCQVVGVIATVNTVHVWQMLLPRWLMEWPPDGAVVVVTIPSVTKTMAITSVKHVKTTCHSINHVVITSTPKVETGYTI